MSILVTGGTGYIGSHTCVELLQSGYDVVVIDNLSNSKRKVIDRIQTLSGKSIDFYEADIMDRNMLDLIFAQNNIEAVIHFAGMKAVGESVEKPLSYYHNNVAGTINLCQAMKGHKIKCLVFSSSATVYGIPESVPITENFPIRAINPYGRTKLMIEEILKDLFNSDHDWKITLLRYFNPVGAHPSGEIGEDPEGIPNNLMPYITSVASGKLSQLYVFGDDYNTHDCTGVRDYIHVVDLSKGHIKALGKIIDAPGVKTFNLGTGKGYSVLDLVKTFENVTNISIPYQVTGRRPGDIDICYADPALAEAELAWKAEGSIEDMCRDAWNWQNKNPFGYKNKQ